MVDGDALETLQKSLVRVFEHDDHALLLSLLAPDCEWTIVASGERFEGRDGVRELTTRVKEAKTHTEAARPSIRASFSDANHICVEFLNRGFLNRPGESASTYFEADFCVVAEVREGAIIRVREYFDSNQFATPPGERAKFFS